MARTAEQEVQAQLKAREHSTSPPYASLADVHAIKAVKAGEADADQQIRFYRWLLAEAAQVNNLSYRPGNKPEDTTFSEGRRFVGINTDRLATMSTTEVKKNYGE